MNDYRWQFLKFGRADELAEQQEALAKIDAWWREFQTKTEQLDALFSGETEWDLPEWMYSHLQGIDPRIMWEFGPAIEAAGHRLVITPEADRHLRPLTDTILERAPNIDGWEFYPYRLPEDVESAQLAVEARTGCEMADVEVRASGGQHNLIDLCFYAPTTSSESDEDARGVSFVATETLLGEEYLDKWVGLIDVATTPTVDDRAAQGAPRLLPLERLRETVDAVIGSIQDQLPDQPHFCWAQEAEWTIWQLEPKEADDYPHQGDLVVGKSANPAMWSAAHSGWSFYSERFSRCGETFCYVKLDGSEGLDEEKFADKSEIEDALDEVLIPQKLGCHIGGGTGRRYSYIDLALVDVDRGIEAIRKRLQEGNISNRSWIQFFDSNLVAEWVGIYDDSPRPPMDDFDEQFEE